MDTKEKTSHTEQRIYKTVGKTTRAINKNADKDSILFEQHITQKD